MVKVGSKVRSVTNRSLTGTVAEILDSENAIVEINATKTRKIKILADMRNWELVDNRLTEHIETSYRLKYCPKDCIRICNGCEALKKAIERLGELEDIDNGLLQKRRERK